MCSGTIKILQINGSIERDKKNSSIILLNSPEVAGKRLHEQAMESLRKKRNKAMHLYSDVVPSVAMTTTRKLIEFS